MKELRELAVDASVQKGATFAEAADVLANAGTSGVAVLDDEKIVGLVTTDDVLKGLFPGYLSELEHTKFIEGEGVAAQLRRADSVDSHMSEPVLVEVDSGAAHLAELFVHQPSGALVVVEQGRYVGVVDERAFVSAMIRSARGQ
jgi:CBS domain-containing protein